MPRSITPVTGTPWTVGTVGTTSLLLVRTTEEYPDMSRGKSPRWACGLDDEQDSLGHHECVKGFFFFKAFFRACRCSLNDRLNAILAQACHRSRNRPLRGLVRLV